MQLRLGIIRILQSFRVSFADNNPPELRMDKTCVLLRPDKPINIKFTLDEIEP